MSWCLKSPATELFVQQLGQANSRANIKAAYNDPLWGKYINTLWPSDAIWQIKSGLTLAQLMACCLMAPNVTWTNVDSLSVRSCDTYLRPILQDITQLSIIKNDLKITYPEFH